MMIKEYLEIPVAGKVSGLTLTVYPQSSNAKVFEESEPYAGESRYQLLEGCTYAYELVNMRDGAENGRYPPTQNGDIRSLFLLFILMAVQN